MNRRLRLLFFRLATKASVTLDIGAHVGFYSILAAHANSQGQIYAFEPMPTVYSRLKNHRWINRLINIKCLSAAIGDVDGCGEFFCVSRTDIPTSSSLSQEFMEGGYPRLEKFTVPVITMDQFVDQNIRGRVDPVKIDTETTEPRVLCGMSKILSQHHPHIFCEVLPGYGLERTIENILRPMNYCFYHLLPQGPVLRQSITPSGAWLNYLFTTLTPDELASISK